MYRVGHREIGAIAEVILSGELFRYHAGGECEAFEKHWAEYLGVRHVRMTSSGTTAITAALAALKIGPGDEVLVPACTYMASAVSVLAVGAIPVVVDVDESITLSPEALEEKIGPNTRAVMPVHIWGLVCDMDRLMEIARRRNILVVEDACQCVGGGYKGRMCGSIGDAGAFSFNYYKVMTCGEGGAVVTNSDEVDRRAGCMIDCCSFYWSGRSDDFIPFTGNGSRASEIEGAMMSAQLGRLPAMLASMRAQKARILAETARTGLTAAPSHSLEWEIGAHVLYNFHTAAQAESFAELVGGGIVGKTGRHIYTEWDPIFAHQGGHVPAMNPYNFPQNEPCRKDYTKDMCAKSIDLCNRTVMIATHPDRPESETTALIERIRDAAEVVL